jgi:hypothetical protein
MVFAVQELPSMCWKHPLQFFWLLFHKTYKQVKILTLSREGFDFNWKIFSTDIYAASRNLVA